MPSNSICNLNRTDVQEPGVRGDCSIRIGGIGFSKEQIAECSQQQGLLSIEIELSASSQCTCAQCQLNPPLAVLSPDEILSVIDQAQKMGAKRIILIDSNTGPYAPLRSIIDACRTKSLEVELFAEDTEITAEFAAFLFDHQVGIGVELNRNEQALPNLSRVGYARHGAPLLAARLFATADNFKLLPQLWRNTRSIGIEPHLQIITPASAGNQPSQLLSPARIRWLFETLAEIDRAEFGITWNTPPELTGRSCKRHLFAAHVTACGTIFACVGVTIPLGNIRAEPLADILKLSEVIEDIRAFEDKVKEPCRTCSKSVDCYGCRGSAYQLTGDYLAGDELCWKAEGVPIESLPVSVAHIIPHGPTIRMVDQLVQLGERRATTSFEIKPDSKWIDATGRLDEVAYIEIIAQSFASSHGFHLTPEQRAAHRGLLLGISNVTITGQARVGDKLKIEIRKITRFGDFGIVEGEVRHEDGQLIAAAQVKVWRPSDEASKAMLP